MKKKKKNSLLLFGLKFMNRANEKENLAQEFEQSKNDRVFLIYLKKLQELPILS